VRRVLSGHPRKALVDHVPQAKVKDLEGQVQALQDSLQTLRLERTRQAGELEALSRLHDTKGSAAFVVTVTSHFSELCFLRRLGCQQAAVLFVKMCGPRPACSAGLQCQPDARRQSSSGADHHGTARKPPHTAARTQQLETRRPPDVVRQGGATELGQHQASTQCCRV